ncbi:transferase [Lithospermum erythrorhizon]|uniref:Sulfotransferase n=1 Tax=Lithospermum erythrorhizon TaxID=34254 RepID=A0AAV3RYE6_LITER
MTNTNQNPGVQNYPFEEYGNGFWLPPKVLQGIISCQNHFQSQDCDIILSTFPKCGTTWLKAFIFTIINRNKHSPLSQEYPLLTKNPHALVPYLEMDLYVANKTPDFSSFTTPRLLATHPPIGLLPKSVVESKCNLVYICKNPKDTFVSFWCF